MTEGTSFTNHLLVAMPSLADPDFSQSVTLVCEHSVGKGALGIVINMLEFFRRVRQARSLLAKLHCMCLFVCWFDCFAG